MNTAVLIKALRLVGTPLCEEAADEVERFQAVLTEISQMKAEDLHIDDGFGFDNFAAYHAANALRLAE